MPTALVLCGAIAATVLAAAAAPDAPSALRVDLQEAQPGASLFITLDLSFGVSPNVSIAWALPPSASAQLSYSLLLTTPTSASSPAANRTVLSLTGVAGAAPLASFPRAALAPATPYDVQVAVSYARAGGGGGGGGAVASAWSAPLRFHTGAGAAQWAGAAPVWAAKCAGAPGPAPPSFAAFAGTAPVALPAASDGILAAYVYATASPPIFTDPWQVTKLFSGFKLFVNGSLAGVGPGHAACGPFAMSSCAPAQPVDAFDVTAAARASVGGAVALYATAYGQQQRDFSLAPAFQAVLVLRFSPAGSAPDALFATAPGAAGWGALDADGVYSPGGNKDSGWYFQPAENQATACLPGADNRPLASCAPAYAGCGFAPLAAAPGAFVNNATGGALPLAGKPTQAVHVTQRLPFAAATRLGAGWWLLDPSFELQGGFALRLAQNISSSRAPGGVRAVVQLSDELAANGSALWQTRAGMRYRDEWTFPPPAAAGVQPYHLAAEHHEVCEFRYAELILTDAASGAPLDLDPSAGDFEAVLWRVHYRYNDAAAAAVATDDADLDAVWALAAATLKTTTMDIYSDSNTRQRSFDCMADNNVAALSHYSTTTELALPRMMSAQQMAIGEQGYISPNWGDWTVLPGLSVVLDALYTGELGFAATLFDKLLANHTYAWAVRENALVHVDGVGALVDTSGGDDDGFQDSPYNSVLQAWCYLAMRRVAQLGRWLGRPEAAALDATADALRAAFQRLSVNGSAGDGLRAVCDGLCATTPHASAHSSFYALYAGLLDDDEAATRAVAAYVRARAAADPVVGIPCGAYPVQFLLAGLYADGADHGAAAHAVLTARTRHSYLSMIETYGATATMECWTPEELPNLSFSHVWSSSPAIIIPQLFFGVRPTAPGWATLDVQPQPGPVLRGSATLPTVRGPLAVAFEQTLPGGGCMSLDLTVPGGAVARAFLPRYNSTIAVKLDGVAVASAVLGDYAAVLVGAGAHSLTSC